jgi:hypothetical protein
MKREKGKRRNCEQKRKEKGERGKTGGWRWNIDVSWDEKKYYFKRRGRDMVYWPIYVYEDHNGLLEGRDYIYLKINTASWSKQFLLKFHQLEIFI